jgi:hypothetical protein
MRKSIQFLLVGLFSTILLTACTNPPNDKVTEARGVIDSVIASGGQEFAPEKVASFQKRYDDALKEIKYQDTLFFKNYSVATYNLNQLMDECDELKAQIAKSKGEPVVAIAKRVKFPE